MCHLDSRFGYPICGFTVGGRSTPSRPLSHKRSYLELMTTAVNDFDFEIIALTAQTDQERDGRTDRQTTPMQYALRRFAIVCNASRISISLCDPQC